MEETPTATRKTVPKKSFFDFNFNFRSSKISNDEQQSYSKVDQLSANSNKANFKFKHAET